MIQLRDKIVTINKTMSKYKDNIKRKDNSEKISFNADLRKSMVRLRSPLTLSEIEGSNADIPRFVFGNICDNLRYICDYLRSKRISQRIRKIPCQSLTGFTLVEVMLAAAILVTVLVGILATYISCIELAATAKNLTYSVNAVQRQIEDIRDADFFDIFADFDNQTFTVNEIPAGSSMGVIYVTKENGSTCTSDDDCGDPKRVTVSVCWRQRGNRIIGEDDGRDGGTALDGILNGGEDLNSNGIIDSPAQLITLITVR